MTKVTSYSPAAHGCSTRYFKVEITKEDRDFLLNLENTTAIDIYTIIAACIDNGLRNLRTNTKKDKD